MENAISEKGLFSPSIERLTRLKSVASAKKKPEMKNISDPLHFISLLFSCVSVLRGAFGESTMTAGTQTLIPIITFLVLSIGLVIVLAVLLWKTKTALNVATFKINQHQEAQHLTN